MKSLPNYRVNSQRDFSNPNSPQYLNEFVTFYDTWLMNKYIGGGIRILDGIAIIVNQVYMLKKVSFATCILIIIT